MKRTISLLVLFAFVVGCVFPPLGFSQTLTAVGLMPQPGALVSLTPAYVPAHLKGMTMDLNDPFKFEFMVSRGDDNLTYDEKQVEYSRLIKYFLAALAVPDTDQWVNLSPYEHERIIPDDFGKTEMGRDLLAQDYLLKQLSASLTHPDTDLGKKFWAGVYARAQEQFGTTDIPADTFNKVWITPDRAVIYETGDSVYVLENHLKVQMESDYLAMRNNDVSGPLPTRGHAAPFVSVSPSTLPADPLLNMKATQGNNPVLSSDISNQIMRAIIIPALEKEVNEGRNFAPLRQVYSGMLLATWYKRALKESILGKLYADKGKVHGIDQDPKNNQQIYEQYVQTFKQGVFNMIREEVDPDAQEVVARKYFSGGTKNTYAFEGVIDEAQESDATVDFSANVEKIDRVPVVLKDAPAPMAYAENHKKSVIESLSDSHFGSHISKASREIYELEREFSHASDQQRALSLSRALGRRLMARAMSQLGMKNYSEALNDYKDAHTYVVSAEDQESFSTLWQMSGNRSLDSRYPVMTNGGIDMNVAGLDIQIRRDGHGVPLPISRQGLENVHINGLVPVILDIHPAAIRSFLN